MRVLITGNMGYVGPAVVTHLRRTYPHYTLLGFDTGLFAGRLTSKGMLPETQLNAQYFGDVRDFPDGLLREVDAVVHLAAISNDPMGNRFEVATDEINRKASVELAARASAAKVARFVFASSCSVYGLADDQPRRETDPVNPLTAYAKSKIATEQALAQMDLNGMVTSCLRFATACGMSDRLRLDLVLNDFVASALSTGTITVLSDGSPWRPLIDVTDMARAIDWALHRPLEQGGAILRVNVGCDENNHRVRDLARAVSAQIPDTSVSINTAAPVDSRSYRVDFGLYRNLAPNHQPTTTLNDSIANLIAGLRAAAFNDREFRHSASLMRLNTITSLLESGQINQSFRWGANK
jgi:nucleoside-diphosphate-sugar epimerase